MVVEDAFRYQVSVQVQLTLIFSSTAQRNGLRECDVGQSCVSISWSAANSLEFGSVMKNGQDKCGIPGHVYFTPELRVIVAGGVKDHGV